MTKTDMSSVPSIQMDGMVILEWSVVMTVMIRLVRIMFPFCGILIKMRMDKEIRRNRFCLAMRPVGMSSIQMTAMMQKHLFFLEHPSYVMG